MTPPRDIPERLDFLLDPEQANPVIEALAERFALRHLPDEARRLTYWDTFDWRLHRDESRLSTEPGPSGEEWVWRHGDGRLRHVLPLRDGDPPTMADDLPPGPLHDELEAVISMRRLLPIARVEIRGPRVAVLDERDKTVVRVAVEQIEVTPALGGDPRALPGRLRVEPVRGYVDEFRAVLRHLGDRFAFERAPRGRFAAVVEAVGRAPGDYTSKVTLKLDPGQRAVDAARHIHRALLDTLAANEDGVRRDLDSEFLHDFRVAVRRMRSALSQIRGVFPADRVEHWKRELRWLGQITTPCRDLDVYLLKLPTYREQLPAAARDDLDGLERFLVQKKASELRRLVAALDTPRYRHVVRDFRAFLDDSGEPDRAATPNAERPIREVASERIRKAHRKVVKRGLVIDDDSPAERLHDLRKDAKKLRYLMEFFRSLYPKKAISRSIKELKYLQDNLGDFNDYEVQQDSLSHFADEMAEGGLADTATLLATGRLLGHLADGQDRERHRFAERFERFASDANLDRFRRLFGSRGN